MVGTDAIVPLTLIHIRRYKPLSVQFPAPGVYFGKIGLVLPDLDPTIMGRIAGAEPLVIEFSTEVPIEAHVILKMIEDNLEKLKDVSDQVAQPLNHNMLERLQIGAATYKGNSKRYLIAMRNPRKIRE